MRGRRDSALVPLSHDHHQALAQALRLKRAGDDDREDVIAQFLAFWHDHGQRHFAIEENLLLPAFARYVPSNDETIVKVLTDHVEIRKRTDDLARRSHAGVGDLNELGKLLDDHVRLEERVLFERMQEVMPRDELDSLGEAIVTAEGPGAPS